MRNRKTVRTGFLPLKIDERFCSLSLTVKVEAKQVLEFKIKAKWVLIDWENGWSELKRAKFELAGMYNIKITGEKIEWLNIDGCGVTFIDLIRCNFLRRLRCQGNKLQELNLRNCPALTFVDCSRNELEYVQVANREKLREFKGNDNRLQVVDFSGCSELRKVDLDNNNEELVLIAKKCRKLKHILLGEVPFDMKMYRSDTPIIC